MTYSASMRVWRGDESCGELREFTVEVNEGEVVLDVILRLQQTQTPDSAVVRRELQSWQVRILLGRDQRQTATDVHDADVDIRRGRDRHGHPNADVFR